MLPKVPLLLRSNIPRVDLRLLEFDERVVKGEESGAVTPSGCEVLPPLLCDEEEFKRLSGSCHKEQKQHMAVTVICLFNLY